MLGRVSQPSYCLVDQVGATNVIGTKIVGLIALINVSRCGQNHPRPGQIHRSHQLRQNLVGSPG